MLQTGKIRLPFAEKRTIMATVQQENDMLFKIHYDKEKECVFVTFTGVISMPVVNEYIAALLPVLEETDCRRLLSDCRNAVIQLNSRDIMQFPKMAEASPLTARLKRAVVASSGTSGYELYEALSKVMDQQLRVFENPEEALEWLMEDSG